MATFNPEDWLILLITFTIACIVTFSVRWLILTRYKDLTADQRLPRQLILLAVTIAAIVSIVLALPVQESSRNQLLGLLGVLLSGVIAFSSTSIVANFMAGLVLTLNRPFKTGDYIRCNGLAGRVIEKSLLDTEIQTEQRTLIHIANSMLINHPVEVVRTSGTFITAEVSLAYDVHHAIIETHLIKAAQNADLNDAFVHVTQLGDFSVNYKVSGMLLDTKLILTTRSKLHTCILDELHNNDIEILSPNFIASRPTDPEHQYLAKASKKTVEVAITQEDIAFDKAEEAEQVDTQRTQILAQIEDLKLSLADATREQKDAIKAQITELEAGFASLEAKQKVE